MALIPVLFAYCDQLFSTINQTIHQTQQHGSSWCFGVIQHVYVNKAISFSNWSEWSICGGNILRYMDLNTFTGSRRLMCRIYAQYVNGNKGTCDPVQCCDSFWCNLCYKGISHCMLGYVLFNGINSVLVLVFLLDLLIIRKIQNVAGLIL